LALNTSNGIMYSAPRIIQTLDTRAGCPGTLSSGGVIISHSFTVSNPCVYWSHGRVIFSGKARADFELHVNGTNRKSALDTTLTTAGAVGSWEELDASFMGTLSAGTHTIAMIASNGTNNWGCGGDWGQLITMVWEVA